MAVMSAQQWERLNGSALDIKDSYGGKFYGMHIHHN